MHRSSEKKEINGDGELSEKTGSDFSLREVVSDRPEKNKEHE